METLPRNSSHTAGSGAPLSAVVVPSSVLLLKCTSDGVKLKSFSHCTEVCLFSILKLKWHVAWFS